MLLAGVLFAVFQQAAGQDQMVMMQQWVLSSLPNFTKRSPVSHSMWCLTVFFFSAAADNCHLQVFILIIILKVQQSFKKQMCMVFWFQHDFNNRFLRERGMVSNPKMEYQVFLCIFQKNSTMATFGLLQTFYKKMQKKSLVLLKVGWTTCLIPLFSS